MSRCRLSIIDGRNQLKVDKYYRSRRMSTVVAKLKICEAQVAGYMTPTCGFLQIFARLERW